MFFFNHPKIQIPQVLKKLNSIFNQSGFNSYLVGGAVRDIFLNKKPSDWDLTTNATPEQVIKLFKNVIPTGIAHGTVTVHFMGKEIEVTTFRTESEYSDGRHPDCVNYTSCIDDDLSRRDFTMNAIAVNLKTGKIIDLFNGKKDIKKKIIRTVGNPHERFLEDGLRPVRAIRFSCQLNFSIEKYTYLEIFKKEVLQKVSSISVERFRDEFVKILESNVPSIGLKKMEECGIMKIFLNDFLICRNCIQGDFRGFHKFDVLDHLFYACDGAPKDKLNVRLAALFHDIGKPTVKKIEKTDDGDKFTFYNHEIESEKIARRVLVSLKFPNSIVDDVCHLVKLHMFHYECNWTDAAVRRFIIKARPECIDDLFDLRLADIYGMNNVKTICNSTVSNNLLEFRDRIDALIKKNSALCLKDLKINGNDLMQIGIGPGKIIGIVLNELFNVVIEDPNENEHEKLMKLAENFYNQNYKK